MIRGLRYATNTNQNVIRCESGRDPQIVKSRAREGWIELEQACANDSDPRVREHGFQAYKDYDAACRAGRISSNPTGDPNSVQGVQKNWQKFPDDLLPQIVKDRRDGKTPEQQPWQPPVVPKRKSA